MLDKTVDLTSGMHCIHDEGKGNSWAMRLISAICLVCNSGDVVNTNEVRMEQVIQALHNSGTLSPAASPITTTDLTELIDRLWI